MDVIVRCKTNDSEGVAYTLERKNRCELVCFYYHYSCTPLGRGVPEITLCDEPHVNNTDEMGREVAVHIALVASSCSGMQQTLSGFDSPTYMC